MSDANPNEPIATPEPNPREAKNQNASEQDEVREKEDATLGSEPAAAGDTNSQRESSSEPGNEKSVSGNSPTSSEPTGESKLRDELFDHVKQVLNNTFGTINITGPVGSIGSSIGTNAHSSPQEAVGSAIIRRIAGEKIQELQNVYVEIESLPHALTKLKENRFLIIRGEQNTGREATAIWLLSRIYEAQVSEVHDFPANPERFEMKGKNGYLLRNINLSDNSDFDKRFGSFQDALKSQDCHAIVVMDGHQRVSKRIDPLEHILDWKSSENYEEILHRHVAYFIKRLHGGEEVEVVLDEVVKTFLTERQFSPGDLAALSKPLAKCYFDKSDISVVLTNHREASQKRIARLFGNKADGDDTQSLTFTGKLLLLSIAAFYGCPYIDIFHAQKDLEEQLTPTPVTMSQNQSATPQQSTVFDSTTSKSLADMGAHFVEKFLSTHYGTVPVQVIEFLGTSDRKYILSHCWSQYIELREVLVGWLQERAEDQGNPTYVREAAADTLGELMLYDFDYILSCVVSEWAKSDNAAEIKLACRSLAVPLVGGNLVNQVLTLSKHWLSVNNYSLNLTAINFYSSYVGYYYPDIAIDALFPLLKGDQFVNAVEGMKTLFYFGDISVRGSILLRVLDQLRKKPKNGQEAFVKHNFSFLIYELMQSELYQDLDSEVWPLLLHYSATDDGSRLLVTEVIEEAWMVFEVRDSISEEIGRWTKQCQPNSRMYRAMGRLFSGLLHCKYSNIPGRLLGLLKIWSKEKHAGAPPLLLEALTKIGNLTPSGSS